MSGIVLLTGATGFVGRQVMRALEERGEKVRVVIRAGGRKGIESSPSVEVLTTPDLFAERSDWCAEVCRGVDTVIHAAWYVEPPKYLQSPRNLDCLSGTLELAKGASQAGVRRFVGIGTCFEYDLSGGVLSTDTPLRPLSPYAGAKAACFQALSRWLPTQKIEFAWCRLFYLFGEGEDERRLVPYLRSRFSAGEAAELGSGEEVRDYLNVAEAGHLIVDVALGSTQGPVNVCSGTPITVRQLAERIADEYGRRDLLRFGVRPSGGFNPPHVVGARHEHSS